MWATPGGSQNEADDNEEPKPQQNATQAPPSRECKDAHIIAHDDC